jgi:hypothetical protein
VRKHETTRIGVLVTLRDRPVIDGPPTASQALCSVAAVVAVVVLVLALLVLGVYAVVFVDLIPQMQ